MHATAWLATLLPRTARTSSTDVAALRRLGSLNSLRISGDLPELHPDLQINHEAGKHSFRSWQPGSRAHLILFPDYCND